MKEEGTAHIRVMEGDKTKHKIAKRKVLTQGDADKVINEEFKKRKIGSA